MRPAVRRETHYDDDTPLAYSAQRLHLWPVDFATQKMIYSWITAPGFDKPLRYWDGFGNHVYKSTFRNIPGPVRIVADGIIGV